MCIGCAISKADPMMKLEFKEVSLSIVAVKDKGNEEQEWTGKAFKLPCGYDPCEMRRARKENLA